MLKMQVSNPPLISLRELVDLARSAKGEIHHIYLHWTAGRYEQFFDDYHLNIDSKGGLRQTCSQLTELKAHTYKRNSGAIGIALCCALDASWTGERPDFGSVPPTFEQLETLCRVVALLCMVLGLPIDDSTVLSHAEAATLDGYGPGSGDADTRWDLAYVPHLRFKVMGSYRGGPFVRYYAQNYRRLVEDGLGLERALDVLSGAGLVPANDERRF